MKKIFSLLLLCFLSFSLVGQSKVSINVTNTSLKDVFANIHDKYGYSFAYSNDELDDTQKVSLSLNDVAVDDLLATIFKNKNVSHNVNNKVVVIKSTQQVGQKKKISGVIHDQTGLAAIGVSIVETGTSNGTLTDSEGRFKLEVSEKSSITISYIGYIKQTISTATKSIFEIKIEEDTKMLEEVVVTALGIKREKKALGYAVQDVSGIGLQTVKGTDLGTSLTGKVAGLNVLNTTEFGDGPTVQIRGEKPLLVIDGVPYENMTLRDVPADDVESMSVLKGATASALYGYKGGNGAIMITTKRGDEEGKLKVSVNSSMMFNAGHLAIPEVQSTYGRKVNATTNEYSMSGDGSWGVPMDGREVIQWDPISKGMKAMPYLPKGKKNFQNFLQQGFVANNNVSVSQQGKLGGFRASGTWVRNKGQYPNSRFDKFTYSMAGDIKVDKFTLTSNMSFNKHSSPNLGFGGYTGYDPMYSLLIWMAQDLDIRDYKDYWVVEDEVQNTSYTSDNNNPYFDRRERIKKFDRDIFNGSFTTRYDILSWLNATARVGFDTFSDNTQVRISQGSFTGPGSTTVIENGREIWGETRRGSFNTGTSKGHSINADFMVGAEKTFGALTLDGLLGGSMFYKNNTGIEAFTDGGLTVPGFYSLKSSVNSPRVGSNLYRQQVNSVYARLAASWKSMVFVEGTLRNDWNSTLEKDNRSYLYPSISGSFIASEVLPKADWLSLWKFRGSWTVSKKAANIYDISNAYNINTNAWGKMTSSTLPTSLRLPGLANETAATFEIGTEVNLLKNRASIDVAYYQEKMYDRLINVDVSPSSGFNKNFINFGEEITRKGLEITLNGTPIETKDWKWDISLNWSKYARYYTKIDTEFSEDKPWIKKGQRADHFILREYLKDNDGNIIHSNGLPQYSSYDSKYGHTDPDWIWGIHSNLKFKEWRFSMSMDGRVGGTIPTTTEMYMWRVGSHPNSLVPERESEANGKGNSYVGKGVYVVSGAATYDTYGNVLSDNRVFAANDTKVSYERYMNAYHKGTAWGGAPSSVDAYSGTFFKLREISLGYTLPKNLSKKIKANNVEVSVVAQNVYLWAKDFKYSDPDGGKEDFADPSPRYVGFNVKLDF